MLTFFRRIRKGLLDMGAISKYLLYAVGEIALVVIGILIALQINTLNINRINKGLEIFYIGGIIQEIKLDLDKLNRNIYLDSLKVESGNYLLGHFKNPTLKNDSLLLMHFGNLSPITYYQQNDIVFEDMKSSGRLNIISNDSLRNNIQRYYNHGEQITDVLEANEKMSLEIYMYHTFSGEFDMNSVYHLLGGSFANAEGMVEVTSFDSQLFYKPLNNPLIKEFIDRISGNILLAQLNVNRLKIGRENANKLTSELKYHLKINKTKG